MEYETGDDVKAPAGDEAKPPKGGKLVDSAKAAARIQRELDASKKWMGDFHRGARECEKAYLDRGDATVENSLSNYSGKVNLFWSNVQVMLSAIYGRLPKAEVDRKFKDFDDDVARVAGIIMQRILNSDIEREHDDTNAALRDAVQDRFISGLGQVWCRFEVETEEVDEPVTDPMTGAPLLGEDGQPQTQPVERILTEEAQTDFVYWDDFRYSPCRRWRECRWVARREYFSEGKLRKRFKLTDEQVNMVPMVSRSPQTTDGDGGGQDDVLRATPFKQAAVWELWDKDRNCAYWYVEGCSFVLDEQEDPLRLEDFFPCPQPLVATTLTKAFLPRSDYAMAQDLYKELDRINSKLSHLTDAVKAAGVYDKNAGPLKQLLTTAVENALVPADNWSVFVEKGGLKGVVDWMPIDQFVNAIVQLNQRKQQLQHDLYEVLGISDIMRGTSVASETATAQELKVQFGGARLSNLQNDVARFVSAVMRIRANIISEHFQPETLLKRSQIERTPDAALAGPAVKLLKDFGTAMYSVVVTSDTLAAPDWAAEKEARTEFLGATSNYLMAAGPVVQQNPMVGSFLIKLLQWAAAGFKGGKTIEGVLDQAAQQLEKSAQQPAPPPPPTPEDRKNEAAANKAQADADKTAKETALMPEPMQMQPPVGQMNLPAGPGTVAPMQPLPPAPLNAPM
jgi:hypothetical protein